MFRAAYRNFGLTDRNKSNKSKKKSKKFESIVVSHTVDVGDDRAGVRWAELRNHGHGFETYQAGTYAPDDGEHRWMGSASINKKGDIAIGYSISSESTFPSVRMAARKSDDPLGELGEEMECVMGLGSQITSANRWGDYSSMSVDPKGEQTFWYTQEYYDATGAFDFKTRVCSFKVKK